MRNSLINFIDKYFPNLCHKNHVRFELGEPYENGTQERLDQVNYRVQKIFYELFKNQDEVYLYIKDYLVEDVMFGDTTPNYLYELLTNFNIESEIFTLTDEDTGEIINHKLRESIIHSKIENINFNNIFSGIANYEQGKEPSIGQLVYIISMSKNIIFHMYDDRGCIVYSNEINALQYIYNIYNDWIVDYWRPTIDKIFK